MTFRALGRYWQVPACVMIGADASAVGARARRGIRGRGRAEPVRTVVAAQCGRERVVVMTRRRSVPCPDPWRRVRVEAIVAVVRRWTPFAAATRCRVLLSGASRWPVGVPAGAGLLARQPACPGFACRLLDACVLNILDPV